MARPLSWEPRLPEILRSVENSARSHFDTKALARLFQLQPRMARVLMERLATNEALGRSGLVAREGLLRFLEEVRDADDAAKVVREQAGTVSHKQPRRLVLMEGWEGARLAQLPPAIQLSPGVLQVRFDTAQGLADALATFAGALLNDIDEFEYTLCGGKELAERRAAARVERDELDRILKLPHEEFMREQLGAGFDAWMSRKKASASVSDRGQTDTTEPLRA